MSKLAFRNLAQPGGPEFSEAQVKTLAASYQVKDGPNDAGEMFERPGRAADRIPSPFPNKQAAAAANGGAIPPDLSVIAKARTYERGFPWFVFDIFTQFQEQGVDYSAALLQGYVEPEHGIEVPPGKYYNKYFPAKIISMPKPLSDGQVEYVKGADGKPQAPETVAQYAKDVSAFLMWAAEPHMEQRKETGFRVLAFLLVFAGLLYFTKKKIWSRVEGHAHGPAF
jgi:cytochrome c1